MALLFLVLLGIGTSSVFANVNFVVRDCASNKATELGTIPNAKLAPYPVPVPGDIHVTGSVRVNRNVTSNSGIKLDLTVERYVGFFWLTVPCISEVGSCTYSDLCGLLDQHFGASGDATCPPQVLAAGVSSCQCPFSAGTYSMSDTVFQVPELTGLWSWLAEGDYRVTAKLVDSASGSELACQHVEATIVDGHPACSGFLCSIFG